MGVAGHRRLLAQPGGLTLGFVLHLVFFDVTEYDSVGGPRFIELPEPSSYPCHYKDTL